MNNADFETLKNKARFQDLNFLRWARVTGNPNQQQMIQAGAKNVPAQCWDFYDISVGFGGTTMTPKNAGANFSPSLLEPAGKECTTNAPPKTGIVNFFYKDYTSTLPPPLKIW